MYSVRLTEESKEFINLFNKKKIEYLGTIKKAFNQNPGNYTARVISDLEKFDNYLLQSKKKLTDVHKQKYQLYKKKVAKFLSEHYQILFKLHLLSIYECVDETSRAIYELLTHPCVAQWARYISGFTQYLKRRQPFSEEELRKVLSDIPRMYECCGNYDLGEQIRDLILKRQNAIMTLQTCFDKQMEKTNELVMAQQQEDLMDYSKYDELVHLKAEIAELRKEEYIQENNPTYIHGWMTSDDLRKNVSDFDNLSDNPYVNEYYGVNFLYSRREAPKAFMNIYRNHKPLCNHTHYFPSGMFRSEITVLGQTKYTHFSQEPIRVSLVKPSSIPGFLAPAEALGSLDVPEWKTAKAIEKAITMTIQIQDLENLIKNNPDLLESDKQQAEMLHNKVTEFLLSNPCVPVELREKWCGLLMRFFCNVHPFTADCARVAVQQLVLLSKFVVSEQKRSTDYIIKKVTSLTVNNIAELITIFRNAVTNGNDYYTVIESQFGFEMLSTLLTGTGKLSAPTEDLKAVIDILRSYLTTLPNDQLQIASQRDSRYILPEPLDQAARALLEGLISSVEKHFGKKIMLINNLK